MDTSPGPPAAPATAPPVRALDGRGVVMHRDAAQAPLRPVTPRDAPARRLLHAQRHGHHQPDRLHLHPVRPGQLLRGRQGHSGVQHGARRLRRQQDHVQRLRHPRSGCAWLLLCRPRGLARACTVCGLAIALPRRPPAAGAWMCVGSLRPPPTRYRPPPTRPAPRLPSARVHGSPRLRLGRQRQLDDMPRGHLQPWVQHTPVLSLPGRPHDGWRGVDAARRLLHAAWKLLLPRQGRPLRPWHVQGPCVARAQSSRVGLHSKPQCLA